MLLGMCEYSLIWDGLILVTAATTNVVQLLSIKIGGFCALCDKSMKFGIQVLQVLRVILRSDPPPI